MRPNLTYASHPSLMHDHTLFKGHVRMVGSGSDFFRPKIDRTPIFSGFN
jgi:hypothetical protein